MYSMLQFLYTMSKGYQPAPIGFSAAPPPSAPPSYAQAVGGVPPQAPYYPQQQPTPVAAGGNFFFSYSLVYFAYGNDKSLIFTHVLQRLV